MAAARTQTRPLGIRHWASNQLLDLAESQLLAPVKSRLQPLIDVLHHTPEVAWCVLLAPVVLLGGVLMARRSTGSRVSTGSWVLTATDAVQCLEWKKPIRMELLHSDSCRQPCAGAYNKALPAI